MQKLIFQKLMCSLTDFSNTCANNMSTITFEKNILFRRINNSVSYLWSFPSYTGLQNPYPDSAKFLAVGVVRTTPHRLSLSIERSVKRHHGTISSAPIDLLPVTTSYSKMHFYINHWQAGLSYRPAHSSKQIN